MYAIRSYYVKEKRKVDENFFTLSKYLLDQINNKGIRVAFGTHDIKLQEQIKNEAKKREIPNNLLEFQMLYA